MNKYISIVLLKTLNENTLETTFDETILEIQAESIKKAEILAQEYGVSCETSYKNSSDEKLTISFVKLIDTTAPLREVAENQVLELYSRSFTNYEL